MSFGFKFVYDKLDEMFSADIVPVSRRSLRCKTSLMVASFTTANEVAQDRPASLSNKHSQDVDRELQMKFLPK